MSLTLKQRKFADYYIEYGNATEAAKKAGYCSKSAYSIGNENLKKPEIKSYIADRLTEIESKSIASIEEIMKFYTAVMRGEERDCFGADISVGDRLKAAQELIKRLSAGSQDTQELENDGLIEALERDAQGIFDSGDDSNMLPEEEE